jgi:hypothetical protein
MDFASDIALMYDEFGVDVLHTPATGAPAAGRAIFDQPGMAMIGGEVLATEFGLRYAATTFPAVRRGDRLAVAGVPYTARENPQPTLDGLEFTVPLARS